MAGLHSRPARVANRGTGSMVAERHRDYRAHAQETDHHGR